MIAARVWLWLSVAAIAAIVATLASSLPPDAFFVGDPGVKLVATRNALSHPTRPFEIDPPVVKGVALPEFADPFYVPHGDHMHAVTSPVFPVLSSPFFALFGLRGLYVLPAIGLLGALLGVVLILRNLGYGTRPSILWMGFALSPLLFYGLEFWEHSCAAAFAYLSTALFIAPRGSRGTSAAAGVLMGAAIVMRPEAACYAVAMVAAAWFLPKSLSVSSLAAFGAGIALCLAPLLAFNLSHLGTVFGLHVDANVVRFDGSWLGSRMALQGWLSLTNPWAVFLLGAVVAICAGASIWSALLPAARLAVILAAAAMSALSAARLIPSVSLWAVLPGVLLLLLPPRSSAQVFNRVLVGLTIALVILMAPNDGGGQWGPRYLLLISGPAIVAMWLECREAISRSPRSATVAVLALVIASAAVQRQAFKEIRAVKQGYKRLQTAVRSEAQPGIVLTDVWWLDQIAGTGGPPPVFLYVATERLRAAAARLDGAGVTSFTLVTNVAPGAEQSAERSVEGTRFQRVADHVLSDFPLVAYSIQRTPSIDYTHRP